VPNSLRQVSLTGIRLHPIKSLDPATVTEARIGPAGGLELDRAWALYSIDGRWVNGKRTAAIHHIRASFAPGLSAVTLAAPGDRRGLPPRIIEFPGDTESAALWFSIFFEQQILVRHSREGFPDDTIAHGPTIVSTASLEKVCEWFPGTTVEELRRRFRTTLEIGAAPAANGALPAFWEDQLFASDASSFPRFRIGEVAFEGSNPCARCPVPPRDTFTGADTAGFQKRFSDLRRETLQPWSPAARFDHFYRFATNTRIAPAEQGKLLRVGDTLSFG
jgi:uncharacterized protein